MKEHQLRFNFFILWTLILILFALPIEGAIFGGSFRERGELTFEHRRFLKNDQDPTTENLSLGFLARFETRYQKSIGDVNSFWGGDLRVTLGGYGRVDQKDQNRSFATFEDANIAYRFGASGQYQILVGHKLFNWSVMDAFYPADMINSRNFDSSPDNLEKIGEFTVELSVDFWNGELNFYYFPLFEQPRYPGASNRFGQGVNLGPAKVVDGQEASSQRSVDQYGVRIYQYLLGADISLHYLDRIDRYFPVVGYADFNIDPFSGFVVPVDQNDMRPYLYRSEQVGATVQKPLTSGLVFKFEGVRRWFDEDSYQVLDAQSLLLGNPQFISPKTHSDISFGFDYTWGFLDGSEMNFVVEHSFISGLEKEERRRLSVFQRDLMLGVRYAFNDINSKEFTINGIFDLERSQEFILNLSYEQRLGDFWGLSTGVTWFEASDNQENELSSAFGLSALRDEQYYFLNLTRYF